MKSREEIETEANAWIRSQGWSEETLPSDEYNQMVSAYVAGHYAGWNAKADDISEMGICFQSDMNKALQQNIELKAEIKRLQAENERLKYETNFKIALSRITHERAVALKENEKLRKEKEWHRDEVPENERDILCQIAKDEFVVGYYHLSNKRYYTTDGQDIDVIAWKEIIPPKQEE